MASTFTLDSLRDELDNEFAPCKIALKDGSEVVLRNILRLDQGVRKTVLDGLGALQLASSDDDDETKKADEVSTLIEKATEILVLVAGTGGRKLAKELDGDLYLILKVLNIWIGDTQVGEASDSPA